MVVLLHSLKNFDGVTAPRVRLLDLNQNAAAGPVRGGYEYTLRYRPTRHIAGTTCLKVCSLLGDCSTTPPSVGTAADHAFVRPTQPEPGFEAFVESHQRWCGQDVVAPAEPSVKRL